MTQPNRTPDRRRPLCELVGDDGNVFSIIARVREALRGAGQEEKASEFMQHVFQSGSFDEILRLCKEYGEVE